MGMLTRLTLALLPSVSIGYPTSLTCSRSLEVGASYMQADAESDTSRTVSFSRDGVELACGDAYVAGETLTASFSDTSEVRLMFEISGGTFPSASEECEDDDSCDATRCAQSDEVTGEVTVQAPSDGSEMSVFVGWAFGFSTVSISDACTLVAAAAADPTPVPSSVVVAETTAPVASPVAASSETIVDIAVSTDELSTLVDALVAADLVDALSGDGPFTVFAPTNDAFDALPEGTLDALLNDTAALTDILLYHVAEGEYFSDELTDGQTITTLQGEDVTVSLSSGVMINDATVTEADIDASNGVIHIIDSVLIPPVEEPADDPDGEQSIVDIVVDRDELSTLLEAASATNLASDILADGTYTLFAPNNDAFDELPDGTLDALLEDTDSLTDLLSYHVAEGEYFSSDLYDGQVIPTLQGSNLTVSIEGETVMINDAIVVEADIDASNGVVHIIDSVLIPEPTTTAPTPEGYIAPTPSPAAAVPAPTMVDAPLAPTTDAPPPRGDGSKKKKKSSSGPSGGVIAAIVICVVVGLAGICGCGWYYSKSQDEKEHPEYAKPDEAKNDATI